MEVKHIQPTYYSSWEKTWSYCCRETPFSTMLRILNSLCRGVTCPSALAILFHAIPYIFFQTLQTMVVIFTIWASFSFLLHLSASVWKTFLRPPSASSKLPSASFCLFLRPPASSNFLLESGGVCKSFWKSFYASSAIVNCCELLWAVVNGFEQLWIVIHFCKFLSLERTAIGFLSCLLHLPAYTFLLISFSYLLTLSASIRFLLFFSTSSSFFHFF